MAWWNNLVQRVTTGLENLRARFKANGTQPDPLKRKKFIQKVILAGFAVGAVLIIAGVWYAVTMGWLSSLVVITAVAILGVMLFVRASKLRTVLVSLILIVAALWYVPYTQHYAKAYVVDPVWRVFATNALKQAQEKKSVSVVSNAQASGSSEPRTQVALGSVPGVSDRELKEAQQRAANAEKERAEAQQRAEREEKQRKAAQQLAADAEKERAEAVARAEKEKAARKVAEEALAKKQPPAKSKGGSQPAKPTVKSVTYLPLVDKTKIPNPKILADRIRESIEKDKFGNTRIRDGYVTPNEILKGVQKSGGTVSGIEALPAYLGALVEGDMPQGETPLNRVRRTAYSDGKVVFGIDIDKGHAREARKGERGWYDANTNLLILADSCSNGPIVPTKGPIEKREETKQEMKTDPAPKKTVVSAQCTKPTFMRPRIWESKAVEVPGVRATMQVEERSVNDYFGDDRVSRKHGPTFLEMEQKGTLKVTSTEYQIVVNHLKADGGAVELYRGPMTGKRTMRLPEEFKKGDVIQVLYSTSVISPPGGEMRAKWEEFKQCTTGLHAIEK